MKWGIGTAAILVVFLVGLAWIGPEPVRAASYVVDNSIDDQFAHDANPGDYVCADTFGACTLRAAIEEANAQGGPHTITFGMTMTVFIDLTEGPLPSLNEQIKLDASGVWDYGSGAPGVMLHGGSGNFSGLSLGANSCEIYGLYITAFNGQGVDITSSSNTIGGAGAGQRNVISGNNRGITLSGTTANNNVIRNNYIGLTAEGTTTNPNTTGILLTQGAKNNLIGGNVAGQSNYISGNTTDGIQIESSGTDNNTLSGNSIGLAADLATTLPNGAAGVRIQNGPKNTFIGGTSSSGNFVTSNGTAGVHLVNAGTGTEVTWNLITGNSADGVTIHETAGCLVQNNIVTSNGLAGVRVYGASAVSNLILPNSITGNGGEGIKLQDGGNTGIAKPVIDSATVWSASGTACASCQVALYSDTGDEGQIYHDLVAVDGSGNWSYAGGPLNGPNLTATAIDSLSNTSEFSEPIAVRPHKIYLPAISRD